MSRGGVGAGQTSGSVAFDRIAEDYDRTRSLPEAVMRKVVEQVASELRDRGRCLEIGVGTGRLALPLADRGIPMAGVDLSLPMLSKLVEKAGGRAPFPVAAADAVALPFPDSSFGAAVASHVLHLVPAWRRALTELTRVVVPDGLVLVDVGGWGTGWWRDLQEVFCREAGISRRFPGVNASAEVDQAMRSLGARPRRLAPITSGVTTTVAERVKELAEGVFSYTWPVEERIRRRAADAACRWAEARLGGLTEPRETTGTITWLGYDLPP